MAVIVVDVDNTIIDYCDVLSNLVRSYCESEQRVAMSHAEAKVKIQSLGGNDLWTLLQGQIYGPLMADAKVFDGFMEFLDSVSDRHSIFLVSHRSRYPYAGPKYDLHSYVLKFFEKEGLDNVFRVNRSLFLKETLEEKIAKIISLEPHIVIDDKLEVLERLDALGCRAAKYWFQPTEFENSEQYERKVVWADIIRDSGSW